MYDYKSIELKLENTIGEKLFKHCYNTMETAIQLADYYKQDKEKAKIAGLLHDCGKLKDKNIGALEHAVDGRNIAMKVYDIKDEEVLDAILYHTTGRPNMTMLEKIIYIADKIEPNRKYAGVDSIREYAFNGYIDKAIIKSFENTFSYLKLQNKEIDNRSYETYECLKKYIQ